MTNENKNAIDSLNPNKLIILYKFIKYLIDYNKVNASERAQLLEMLSYIENKMNYNNMSVPSGDLTENDFNQARNIYSGIRNTNQTYDDSHRSGFLEGVIGLGGFILVVIVIALFKGAFDIAIELWNSGILKIILGVVAVGGITYLGCKKRSSKKIKEKTYENSEKNNSLSNRNTYQNSNIKTKEKNKESNSNVASGIKSGIKNLTIFASTLVVLGTGMAHLNKHSKEFNNTPLADFGKFCRIAYENVYRLIREKTYELSNDYSEYENMGYMDYVNTDSVNNWYNLDYQDHDYCLFINGNYTWPVLSHYCYGDPKFADHLRIYNCRFDSSDDVIHPGDTIIVPNVEKLENYIYSKKLIK